MASSIPPSSAAAVARPSDKAPVPIASSNGPVGIFHPGTKVQVGSHRVIVEKYLSEGGFAHVYVVRVPTSGGKSDAAVLKRVAVPDKEALANMRTEVETMKKLRGHQHIVTYIDSHASQLKGGGYEVFLLMEYCDGGGLIDFMNTRLQNRLKEPEILKIFSDVAEGVACMHYLKPPLVHRDLKVENVLISTTSTSKTYKLCDFGSSAPPRPAANTAAEGRLIEDDVQRHTTLQYRSPEMIDVYKKRPIDEKSDIWALGVLLYKLCYYTTPFEAQGQMAILTASFKYPNFPPFSDRIKKLIATMLTEYPSKRPTIFQVVEEVCSMRGKQVPMKDIYAQRTQSEVRGNQQLPPRELNVKSPPIIGASQEAPAPKKQAIPEVTPMRRGRPPPQDSKKQSAGQTQTPSRASTDPFAALDSSSYTTRAAAVDELSSRYPALDDFSILQEKGSKFQFKDAPKAPPKQDMNQRITNALADEAFSASKEASQKTEPPRSKPLPGLPKDAQAQKPRLAEPAKITSLQSPPLKEPKPEKPAMVSTGTMTSSSPPLPPKESIKPPKVNQRPIWRVPSPSSREHRSSMSLLNDEPSSIPTAPVQRGTSPHGLSFQQPQSPVSSRPSLERMRPSLLEVKKSVHRSKSAETQSRRSSEDWGAPGHRDRALLESGQPDESEASGDDSNITSDVDFLRAMEEEESSRGHHRRISWQRQSKRSSLPSASGSGRKHTLGGKFSDAFRRFEGHGAQRSTQVEPATSNNNLDTSAVDDGSDIDETEDLSPEVRRELERRRLSQEEKRVTEAAAAYRLRMAATDDPSAGTSYVAGPSRASAIQDRVKHLLDESGRTSPVKRTAEGYGRFTDGGSGAQSSQPVVSSKDQPPRQRIVRDDDFTPPSSAPPDLAVQAEFQQDTTSVAIRGGKPPVPPKPAAPPKPMALRTETVPSQRSQQEAESNLTAADDLESFAKRYPSLSVEMIETEISKAERPTTRPIRIKDV